MNVAIIDDGIYCNDNCNIIFPPIHNFTVTEENIVVTEICPDRGAGLSHGTSCFCIYSDVVNRSDYEVYSISILNPAGKCHIGKLEAALSWCLQQNIKLICMSLGSTDFRDFQAIDMILKELAEKNVIVVAACSNHNCVTYPASSKYAIGVRHDYSGVLKYSQYCYTKQDIAGIEVTCHCDFQLLASKVPYTYCLFNSFSAPYIGALVHQGILDGYDTLDKAREYLMGKAVCQPDFQLLTYQRSAFHQWTPLAEIPVILVNTDDHHKGGGFATDLANLFKAEDYNAVVVAESASCSIREGVYSCQSINISNPTALNIELLSNYTLADLLIVAIQPPRSTELLHDEQVNCIISDKDSCYEPIKAFTLQRTAAEMYSSIKDYLINC